MVSQYKQNNKARKEVTICKRKAHVFNVVFFFVRRRGATKVRHTYQKEGCICSCDGLKKKSDVLYAIGLHLFVSIPRL